QMAAPRSWTATLAGLNPFRAKPATAAAGVPAAAPPASAADDPDRPYVGVFLRYLGIQPVRNSRLVKIAFESPDPKLSQQVVNALADAFILSNLERRNDASVYAKAFLEDRLAQTKLKLEDSERLLVEFSQREH